MAGQRTLATIDQESEDAEGYDLPLSFFISYFQQLRLVCYFSANLSPYRQQGSLIDFLIGQTSQHFVNIDTVKVAIDNEREKAQIHHGIQHGYGYFNVSVISQELERQRNRRTERWRERTTEFKGAIHYVCSFDREDLGGGPRTGFNIRISCREPGYLQSDTIEAVGWIHDGGSFIESTGGTCHSMALTNQRRTAQ